MEAKYLLNHFGQLLAYAWLVVYSFFLPFECYIAYWSSGNTPNLFREVTGSNLTGAGFLSSS